MSKSNHFFGQPLYGQLINLLGKGKNTRTKLQQKWRMLY